MSKNVPSKLIQFQVVPNHEQIPGDARITNKAGPVTVIYALDAAGMLWRKGPDSSWEQLNEPRTNGGPAYPGPHRNKPILPRRT